MEGLPALGAAVFPPLTLPVPAALDAASAVTVSAVDGDGFLQQTQTDRAAELLTVQTDFIPAVLQIVLLTGHSAKNDGNTRGADQRGFHSFELPEE